MIGIGPRAPAALIALTLFAGCGGEESAGGERSYLPGNPRAGSGGLSQAPEANCEQWRAGSVEGRRAAIRDIAELFERESAAGGGYSLPDERAYELIDEACSQDYATNFRLYKVYEKALGFQYER